MPTSNAGQPQHGVPVDWETPADFGIVHQPFGDIRACSNNPGMHTSCLVRELNVPLKPGRDYRDHRRKRQSELHLSRSFATVVPS